MANTKILVPKILILGETVDGRRFRPSDWAERVAGCCAQFDASKRLQWHPLVQPVSIEGRKCLAIDISLKTSAPELWNYIREFVDKNHLKGIGSGLNELMITELLNESRAA